MDRKVLIVICLVSLLAAHINQVSGDHFHHKISKRSPDAESPLKSPWLNTDWNKMAKNSLDGAKKLFSEIKTGRAKNVIMFLGDGMGLPTIAAARLFKAEFNSVKSTDIYMAWETFPFSGLARTYNVDRSTPDSAATATAYLAGVKGNMATIGVNEKVLNKNCTNIKGNEVKSSLHRSIEAGKWTGVVTSTRITHASPAGCYASVANRDWEAYVPHDIENRENCRDIAYQLVMDERNQDIRVIFGGGAKNFIPEGTVDEATGVKGKRNDSRDLIEEWKKRRHNNSQSHAVLRDKTDFLNLDVSKTDYVLGLFNSDHLQYEIEKNRTQEPTLEELTLKAIELLKRSEKGFFLFVEGGRIDHAHHDTNAHRALYETLAMEKAVLAASQATSPDDTLIVVTADHSHVFTLGGYGYFEESVLGFGATEPLDGKPMLQLMYANGPGYAYHRNDSLNSTTGLRKSLTRNETRDINFLQDAAVWLKSETHGGEDVAVYASGPWSQLFHRTEEQTYVAHAMMYASCVGDYSLEQHCSSCLIKSHSIYTIILFSILLYLINTQ